MNLQLKGEVRVNFLDEDLTGSEDMFYFWFHTAFHGKHLALLVKDLDFSSSRKKHVHRYHPHFVIEFHFE